ncbi:MAG: VapB-type antitoxin [Nitrososphaerota archaeon]|nr:VapB-type antitoxin [Nitrososphaerota archaeon]MDG7012942.1 VapB-type antitoxin [Nitrososphaerota archaeon]
MSVISVRVDEKVKKRLEEAGVDVPHEVRRRLEELAWQVELAERMARLEKLVKEMPPAPKGYSAKSVREDREGH